MQFHIQNLTMVLLIAAVVAMLSRRLRLPYSVGLVTAGIVVAIFPLGARVLGWKPRRLVWLGA